MSNLKTPNRADIRVRPLALTLTVILAGLFVQDQFRPGYSQLDIRQADNIWSIQQPSRF